MLGLLDESAGLAQACRLADQGLLDADALLRIATPITAGTGTLHVLTGITRADRWTELRAAALALVLERAREWLRSMSWMHGFCLEADEELSFDTMAPRRNAATLRSLEMADTVFAVGAADPIGVPRLVRGLAELSTAMPRHRSQGGAEQGPGIVGGQVSGAAIARSVGAVRPGRAALGVPAGRRRCERRGAALRLAPAGSRTPVSRFERQSPALVCASVQQKRKTSVFTPQQSAGKGLGSP